MSLYEALPQGAIISQNQQDTPTVAYRKCLEDRSKIRIDGILGNEAIVNGEIVTIGKNVLGAKVVEITDHSVWFTCNGMRFEQKMPLL